MASTSSWTWTGPSTWWRWIASNFDPGGALEGYSQTPVNFDETYGDDHNRSTPWPVAMPTNLYYAKADFGFYQACGLSVAKTCVAPAPPSTGFVCSSAKPINSLTMIWNGTQNVRIKAYKGAVGTTLLADIDNIVPGQEITVNGFAGAPNDVIWEIFNPPAPQHQDRRCRTSITPARTST